ncbi:MAG: hypothetical protein HOP91_04465 [Sphingomonas sp.]|nr:hypothetical protein [Sphingomonas sp.]
MTATLAGDAPPVPAARPHLANALQNYLDEQNRIEFDTAGTNLLALVRERNEGWKSLGGVSIDNSHSADPLHQGLLPSRRGLYLHAGPKRQMTLIHISPEEGRKVLGLRALLEVPDKRCPPIEYALAITRAEGTVDLAKVAAWLDRRDPADTATYQLAAPWQQKVDRENEVVMIDWRERDPASGVILALRTVGQDHRYAMLNLAEIEWKAAANSGEAVLPIMPRQS